MHITEQPDSRTAGQPDSYEVWVPEQKLLRNFLVWHTMHQVPVPERKLLRNFLVWHTRYQE